ncbi:hypothetical protein Daus18300_003800 [Diaporthe australafricana]|uniref:F-box domain-containing protein n=1 Tax=Diaporthe australafricana TaxID=127596 RepID=A0ABR3XE74_9PEZI
MDSATALDFETLQTLKLRDCRGWNHLLERIMQLRRPVGLKVLEICESPGLRTCELDPDLRHADLVGVVSEFLATFVGLEGLFVSIEGPADMDRLWSGVINHRATLKRFVHYQGIEDEPDVMTLGYDEPGEISLMSLDEFQLEAIGLTLFPEYLHEENDTEQPVKLERLDFHLKKLVDWAFGPDGIASLQFIACGDWSHGGGRKSQGRKVHDRDVIICRSESETGNGHRVLRRDNSTANEEFEKIVGAHRELLEACPSEQFLPRLWAGFY